MSTRIGIGALEADDGGTTMTRVLALGGCGGIGRHAVRTLLGDDRIDEVVVGDLDGERAACWAAECGPRVRAQRIDVTDQGALQAAISEGHVVMSCVGPYLRRRKNSPLEQQAKRLHVAHPLLLPVLLHVAVAAEHLDAVRHRALAGGESLSDPRAPPIATATAASSSRQASAASASPGTAAASVTDSSPRSTCPPPSRSPRSGSEFEDGTCVGHYVADLVVNGCVLVELKAAQALASEHAAQLLNYLKATGLLVGLLVNFGATKLQLRRFVYQTSRSGTRSAVGST